MIKPYLLLAVAVAALAAGAYVTQQRYDAIAASYAPAAPAPVASAASTTVPPAPIRQRAAAVAPTPARPSAATSGMAVPAPDVTFDVGSTTYRIFVPDGATVASAMRQLASTSDFSYTGHDYPGMGLFVDSINGRANAGGKYWFLYLNGASSQTGASQTVLHPGDIVGWRYESEK